jgi:hypothetical protein
LQWVSIGGGCGGLVFKSVVGGCDEISHEADECKVGKERKPSTVIQYHVSAQYVRGHTYFPGEGLLTRR